MLYPLSYEGCCVGQSNPAGAKAGRHYQARTISQAS